MNILQTPECNFQKQAFAENHGWRSQALPDLVLSRIRVCIQVHLKMVSPDHRLDLDRSRALGEQLSTQPWLPSRSDR